MSLSEIELREFLTCNNVDCRSLKLLWEIDSWHDLYGAEVVGITSDVVEMHVAKPPLDRESALSLAKAQYLYCNDIVEQGTQTLSVLAATLLEGSVWYFWWD
jgi:Domain of unknown function (DUF4253)